MAALNFDPVLIASRLREARLSNKNSIRHISDCIKVPKSTYAGWEKKATINTLFYIPIIENMFNMKPGTILYGKSADRVVHTLMTHIKKS